MAEVLTGRRILLSTDAVGGVWTYSLDLARELGAAGIETVLAVMGPPPRSSAAEAARAIPGLSLVTTDLPLDWLAETPEQVTDAADALGELARGQGCDIVQLHTPALAAGRAYPAPVISIHHSCLATWWSAVKGDEPLPEDFRWRRELVARGLAASEAVVAPTSALAHEVASAYGLASPPTVIRNGRQDIAAPPAGTRSPVILSSGRLWDEGKNFATLDRAAALIDTPVLAAGPDCGPQGGAVEFTALEMLGTLSEERMRHWLSSAPVYVSTALYEPFGLGVLEAAQAGSALVLSDIASFRELWSGAALFVPPRDAEAVARALERVTADAMLQQLLSERARRRAQRYTSRAMAGELMRLYAMLIALSGPECEAAA
ncbi:glycosyltransferase family 4 protein [Aestuariivirga sp.]|uniref:glycosyltransferase family 4 protein n=1 Tax=Aestuariivirga sp. TaxID=2650926 RepID=UPI00391995A0